MRKAVLEKAFYKDYGYTPKQMDKVMEVIGETFGANNLKEENYIAHELESEYVHTDVVITASEDYQYLVTCGMGAREMPNCKAYIGEAYKRIEISLSLSPNYQGTIKEKSIIAQELQRISKYPFRNDTFFGPGHTINVSDEFKEEFGYEYLLFFVPISKVKVAGLGFVHFIPLIPIYEEEREWMVKNNSLEWIVNYFEKKLLNHEN